MTSGDFDECSASVQHYMQNLIRHRLGAHLLQTVDILLHMYTGPTSRSIGGGEEAVLSHLQPPRSVHMISLSAFALVISFYST